MDSRSSQHVFLLGFAALLPLFLGALCDVNLLAPREARRVVVRALVDDIIDDYLIVTPFATFTPTPAAADLAMAGTFTPTPTPTPVPGEDGGNSGSGGSAGGEESPGGAVPPGGSNPPVNPSDTPASQPTTTGTATQVPTATPLPTQTPSATALPTATPWPSDTPLPPPTATSPPDTGKPPTNTPVPPTNTPPPTATFTPVPPVVSFSAANYPAPEDIGSVTINVTLDKASSGNVRVNYATANNTAFAPNDYAPRAGTLNFGPGQTSQTFSVTIVDDAVDDPDTEQFRLTLSGAINATLGSQSTASVTIADNDPLPVLQFSSVNYDVLESGVPTFTLTLDRPSGKNVSFTYAPTIGGTAFENEDYNTLISARTLSPGVDGVGPTSAVLTWPGLIDDIFPEPDETVLIALSGLVNADPGTILTTTLTIIDDDPR